MRWCVLLVAMACLSACKVVNSTRGIDAGNNDEVVVGFTTQYQYVNENAGSIAVVVALSSASSRDISVMYSLIDGTAAQGSDYAVTDSIITFAPGETTRIIPVSIISDNIEEPEEDFHVDLRQPRNAVLGTDRTTITIGSVPTPQVQFDSLSSSSPENDLGSIFLFMDTFSSLPVTVHFSIGGTATFGTDYQIASSTTFPPGSQFEAVGFDVFDDLTFEPDETVTLAIVGVTNGVVGANTTHTHTIVDNDTPNVFFQLSSQSVTEGNTDTTVTATVMLSSPSTQTITVPFFVEPAISTVDGADYTIETPSPLTFPPGAMFADITITVHGDMTVEGLERLGLQLGTPTNAMLGFSSLFDLSISNDDALGSGAYAILMPNAPLVDSVVLPADLDTTDIPCAVGQPVGWVQQGHARVCVVFARSITVLATRAHGHYALVLAATESINILGTLDVSAKLGVPGPGSLQLACNPTVPAGLQGGGAGGSFMTAGGDGGAHTDPAGAGAIAAPALTSAPTALRGGCRGEEGGGNTTPNTVGYGGGALYMVAGNTITVRPGAVINASGAGALTGLVASAGGNGGGSGGMIVLSAPSIQAASSFIVANGGGGAEGIDAMGHAAGGSDPLPTAPTASAPGGAGNAGGNGGRGFAQGSPATAGAAADHDNGAGGGGGGAGFIQSSQPLTGATVTPAP